ncbi:hypothetical protein [Pseudomonas sp. SCT]|uniref:hypothetical protein n=1 Tax=Pseudomonas sp. (strain SCT) TaxID=412955 RepID=UPI000F627E67|nr:hypothetical protein [Pseudomonas sp. SCT]MCO4022454.1 hypothetical protein [Pseudomonas aeruginosa]
MSDVEIWFAQKMELSWFLRINAEVERFLNCAKQLSQKPTFSTESASSCRSAANKYVPSFGPRYPQYWAGEWLVR